MSQEKPASTSLLRPEAEPLPWSELTEKQRVAFLRLHQLLAERAIP